MRVYYYIHSYYPYIAGHAPQWLELCRRLQNEGTSGVIATTRFNKTWLKHEVYKDVSVYRLPYYGSSLIGLLLNSMMFTIFFIKNRNRFDIFNVTWGGLNHYICPLLCKLFNKKCIFTSILQGSDTPEAFINSKFKFILIRLYSLYDAYIGVSYNLYQYLKKLNPSKITCYIPYGVDIHLFKPASNGEIRTLKGSLKLNGKKIILFAGMVIKRKGIFELIDIFNKIHEIDDTVILVIVGANETQQANCIKENDIKKLYKIIRIKKLQQNIIFTGAISEKIDLIKYYQIADLFLFPSHREGLPNVVLESLAVGLPVIVSDLEAIEFVISNNINGYIIRNNHIDEYVNKIKYLLYNPSKREQMSRNARKMIIQEYSFEKYKNRHTELYYSLMG